jgi:hypothetical protein
MTRAFALSGKRWLLAAATAVCAVSLAASSSSTAELKLATSVDEPPANLHMNDIEFQVKLEPFPDTYAGMTHFKTHVVQIDPSSVEEQRRRVFLHEMLHVAWNQGRASADKSKVYTEEEAIQALTPGLLKMLAQNPQSVEYLRAGSAPTSHRDNQPLRTTASK